MGGTGIVQIRRGPKQHSVHDGEHGHVRADTECQREHDAERETGALRQGAQGVAEVGEQGVHHSYLRATIGSTFVARRAGR